MNILFKKRITFKGIYGIIKSVTIYLRSSEGGAWKGVACLGSYQCDYLASVAAIPNDRRARGVRRVCCEQLPSCSLLCIVAAAIEGRHPLEGYINLNFKVSKRRKK